MLEAALEDGEEATFSVPETFDPHDHLAEGRVYRAEEDEEVVVRYSPKVARWILERGDAEPEPDGSTIFRHRAADLAWAVRHVLQYGPDAELLSRRACGRG